MSTQQAALNFDVDVRRPRARTSDPETSHEAAASISRKALSDGQRTILNLLRKFGPMTDEEILEELAEMGWRNQKVRTASSARTRRKEITQDDIHKDRPIKDSGERRKTRSGRNAIVWEAV